MVYHIVSARHTTIVRPVTSFLAPIPRGVPFVRAATIVVAILIFALTIPAARIAGQTSAARDSLRVTFSPPKPPQGSLFSVHVAGLSSDANLSGSAAGEALHFRARPDGSREAFAAAPIDSLSLGVMLVWISEADADTARHSVALARALYPIEQLRVAPRFSASPDSALAARLRREGERAAAVGRASHLTPGLWHEPFRLPRTSRITSGFGRGREFNGTITSRHMGTDFAGATGAPIRAANRGVVRLVDSFFLGGNVVYLDHGEGLVTAYLHLSEHLVAEGDTVERGAILGRVGATGRVTGPHLHWITRYGNTTVDPLSVVTLTRAPPPPGKSQKR